MGGQTASIAATSSYPRAIIPGSRAFNRLKPLLDEHDSTGLKNAIASGAARAEPLRKAIFWKFSTMEIKDPETKKALISKLMACTACDDEKKDLQRILNLETAPSQFQMLDFAYYGATKVLFEYAMTKLISMKHIPNMSPAEREYFEDILSSIVDMASKDSTPNKIQFEAAWSVLTGITNNGASAEVKEMVDGALKTLGMYDPTTPIMYLKK